MIVLIRAEKNFFQLRSPKQTKFMINTGRDLTTSFLNSWPLYFWTVDPLFAYLVTTFNWMRWVGVIFNFLKNISETTNLTFYREILIFCRETNCKCFAAFPSRPSDCKPRRAAASRAERRTCPRRSRRGSCRSSGGRWRAASSNRIYLKVINS